MNINIKKLLPTLLLTCSLFPFSCLANYDTTIAADGSEVRDTVTGLIWRRCSEGQIWSGSTCTVTAITYTHENALLRAKSEAAASGKSWRVPNVKELSSLTKLGTALDPSIDTTVFPETPINWFWTSTPSAGSPAYVRGVSFRDGNFFTNLARNNYSYYYVRLVR